MLFFYFYEVFMKKLFSYFSPFEWSVFLLSTGSILLSFLLSGDFYILTLIASLVGVCALLFIAKGNVVGNFLIVVFSILYSIVSVRFRYYGELITYLFMSTPAAISACISWIKNPSKHSKNEVQISVLSKKQWLFVSIASILLTIVFYFILRYFGTANLLLSTLSITTSAYASLLVILRSRYYAIAYALNDVVLILLWILASIHTLSYLPMVICFLAFLLNDLYGFYNWKRMQKKQENSL